MVVALEAVEDEVVEPEAVPDEEVVGEEAVPDEEVVPEEVDEPDEEPELVPCDPEFVLWGVVVVPDPFPVPPPWGLANGSWYWSSPALWASAEAAGAPRASTRARTEARAAERRMAIQGRSDSGGGRNFPHRALRPPMPMPRALQRLLPTFLALSAIAAATPTPANAGTYDVYGCRTPAGPDASLSGWTGTANAVAGVSIQNSCSSGSGYFGGEVTAGPAARNQPAQWRFESPPNTTIEHYALLRSVRSTAAPGGAKSYGFFEDEVSVDAQHLIETCAPATVSAVPCTAFGDENNQSSSANQLDRSNRNARRLFALVQCTSYTTCGASPSPGNFRIYQSEIGLTETIAPLVSGLSGTLVAAAGSVGGVRSVEFSASDLGGGVEGAEVLVDGVSVASQGMEGQGAGCRRPFVATVPCPLTTSAELPLDTSRLADGLHRVQAQVTDAAGNVGRSGSVVISTKNSSAPVVPNGSTPDRSARLSVSFRGHRVRTVRFRHTELATGRLLSSGGRPIARGAVAVYSRVEQAGARWRGVAILRTGARGRFSYRPRRGASRALRFVYRAYSSDRRPTAARTVRLRVRAGLRLSVTPRALRNGHTAAFRVRLLGGPGRKGTLVSVQVLRPQRTFATRAAGRAGTVLVRHHFRYATRPTTYLFRAVLQAQRGYPYLGAASGVVRLHVRP